MNDVVEVVYVVNGVERPPLEDVATVEQPTS